LSEAKNVYKVKAYKTITFQNIKIITFQRIFC